MKTQGTTRQSMAFRTARKIVVAVVGGTVLAIGLAMVVLPGPAFIVIPIGLAILGTEFIWARRLLRRVQMEARRWTGQGAQPRPAADTAGGRGESSSTAAISPASDLPYR